MVGNWLFTAEKWPEKKIGWKPDGEERNALLSGNQIRHSLGGRLCLDGQHPHHHFSKYFPNVESKFESKIIDDQTGKKNG